MFKLFNKIKTISISELTDEIKKGKQLIDVREVEEFKRGHISGARNLPLSQLTAQSLNKNKKYLLICQSGMRSKKAYKILSKADYDVTNVSGGMVAWRGKIKK
ncbi:rhodanese-like domain-containing protein [Lactococcus cremoris]|uniref:rhodanese-like domain-containing protein n=1 Tax=Lactococcus lactis subsp. cremoris TaxID=1359 RepID=UPI001E3E4247|nr:rhodanese-like domain-containing protein [Lactococcus cremoris]